MCVFVYVCVHACACARVHACVCARAYECVTDIINFPGPNLVACYSKF